MIKLINYRMMISILPPINEAILLKSICCEIFCLCDYLYVLFYEWNIWFCFDAGLISNVLDESCY